MEIILIKFFFLVEKKYLLAIKNGTFKFLVIQIGVENNSGN